MTEPRNLAIVLFDDVELLDFAGPLEVFSVANRQCAAPAFKVYTVAEKQRVVSRNGLAVHPDHLLSATPQPDILLVPGGVGTRREVDNANLVQWLSQRAATCQYVLSVCTGALLLAKIGLLDGLNVTTHHAVCDLLEEMAPKARVHRGRRFLDNGQVITSAGIAAGIDMSLHFVQRLLGEGVATATAEYMEYPWSLAQLGE